MLLIHSGNKDVWQVITWTSWSCIYLTSLLRLYLCWQRFNSYRLLLTTGENSHLIPGSRGKAWKICFGLFIFAHVELLTVLITRYYRSFHEKTNMYTIPFLAIQDFMAILVCILMICMLLFSKLRTYLTLCHNNEVYNAAISLTLISTSSVLTNIFTFYGDITCISSSLEITSYNLLTIKPECFIPFAKTCTYFDSLIFPVVLIYFSKNLRSGISTLIFGHQVIFRLPRNENV